MKAVDQLVLRRRRFRQDAEPAERIDTVVAGEHPRRKARPADAVKAVAAADEIAFDLLRPALMLETNLRIFAGKIVDAGVLNLEEYPSAVGNPLFDQVGDH